MFLKFHSFIVQAEVACSVMVHCTLMNDVALVEGRLWNFMSLLG